MFLLNIIPACGGYSNDLVTIFALEKSAPPNYTSLKCATGQLELVVVNIIFTPGVGILDENLTDPIDLDLDLSKT